MLLNSEAIVIGPHALLDQDVEEYGDEILFQGILSRYRIWNG